MKDNQLPLGSINKEYFLICKTLQRWGGGNTYKRIKIKRKEPMTADYHLQCVPVSWMIIVLINVQVHFYFYTIVARKKEQQMVNKVFQVIICRKKVNSKIVENVGIKQEGLLSNVITDVS